LTHLSSHHTTHIHNVIGSVQLHSWCCPGVSHLWQHTDTSLRPEESHRGSGTEGQASRNDKVWDTVPCMYC